jgi:peptidoglycan/LPS O-acetylase OafA/YrhL
VDILRALAALAVVVSHVPFSGGGLAPSLSLALSGLVRLGRLGVPVFLVLSGFCIHLAVARTLARGEGGRPNWVGFWKRRFRRLYPPYAAAIVVSLALYALAGPSAFPPFERIVSLPWDLLSHLLMVHNLFADYCFGLGNGPFWTLGLEEQLYALYALFLLLRCRRSLGSALGLTLLVSLAWQCGWRCLVGMDDGGPQPTLGPAPLALGRWLKWPLGLWFAWALGAVAAEAYAGGIRLPRWCTHRRTALLLAALGLATSHNALGLVASRVSQAGALPGLLGALAGVSDLAFSASAFVILNRWVTGETTGRFQGRTAHILGALGVMSYSLYLTHLPLVRLLSAWLPHDPTFVGWLCRLAVVVSACLAFAATFFWLIERHCLTAPRSAPAARPGQLAAPSALTGGATRPVLSAPAPLLPQPRECSPSSDRTGRLAERPMVWSR